MMRPLLPWCCRHGVYMSRNHERRCFQCPVRCFRDGCGACGIKGKEDSRKLIGKVIRSPHLRGETLMRGLKVVIAVKVKRKKAKERLTVLSYKGLGKTAIKGGIAVKIERENAKEGLTVLRAAKGWVKLL